MRSILRKLWNTALLMITALAAAGFILFGCMLDSDSWIPFIGCAVCVAWLLLFALANGGMDHVER